MQSLDKVVHYWNAIPPTDIKSYHPKSEQQKPVSRKQRMFVEDCLTTHMTFEQMLEKHHVSSAQMANWFTQSGFATYCDGICEAADRKTRLLMSCGAMRGIKFLFDTASVTSANPKEDANKTSRCRAAETLVKLMMIRRRQRKLENAPPARPLDPIIAHPANTEAENRHLLEKLEEAELKRQRAVRA
jgi:hypothetical protein